MGCLNSGSGFTHWFANIHFSGQCKMKEFGNQFNKILITLCTKAAMKIDKIWK